MFGTSSDGYLTYLTGVHWYHPSVHSKDFCSHVQMFPGGRDKVTLMKTTAQKICISVFPWGNERFAEMIASHWTAKIQVRPGSFSTPALRPHLFCSKRHFFLMHRSFVSCSNIPEDACVLGRETKIIFPNHISTKTGIKLIFSSHISKMMFVSRPFL